MGRVGQTKHHGTPLPLSHTPSNRSGGVGVSWVRLLNVLKPCLLVSVLVLGEVQVESEEVELLGRGEGGLCEGWREG